MARTRTALLLLALGAGLGLGAGLSCPAAPQAPALGAGGAWVALPALPGVRTVVRALAAASEDPGARLSARWAQSPPFTLTAPALGALLPAPPESGLAPGQTVLLQGSGGGLALRQVVQAGPRGWLRLDQEPPPGLGRAGDQVWSLAGALNASEEEITLGAGGRALFHPEGLWLPPPGRPLLVGVQGQGLCRLAILEWGWLP